MYRKKLDESTFNSQMKYIVSKRDSGIPLYLSLACQEMRLFGVFETIAEKLRTVRDESTMTRVEKK
jgi:telomerase protein component 1